MKRYSFKLPLALFLVMLILGSCGPMMYTYYETGYDGTEVVPDTSEWWLKPIYLRTDTASPDSLELKQFVHFHDDEEGVTYIKVSGDNSILFEPRSADINMDALKELFFIAALLSDKPFSEMIIYGSADNTESRDYSMELSEERAETVSAARQARQKRTPSRRSRHAARRCRKATPPRSVSSSAFLGIQRRRVLSSAATISAPAACRLL